MAATKYHPPRLEEYPLRHTFEELYDKWKKEIEDKQLWISSKIEDYTSLESYKEIIRLGDKVLPYIMEKIKKGDFMLNRAVEEITGIVPNEEYKKTFSEQKRSKLWLKWWQEQISNYKAILYIDDSKESKKVQKELKELGIPVKPFKVKDKEMGDIKKVPLLITSSDILTSEKIEDYIKKVKKETQLIL